MQNRQPIILDALPTYGEMYVPISKNAKSYYSQGLAVRFYKSDSTDWVANFELGGTDLNKIIELENSYLIIAGGTCYLMNPGEKLPIDIFGVGYTYILPASSKRYVLIDQVDLTVVETNGQHWDTVQISWDGMKDVVISNDIIRGLSYDPMPDFGDWVEFQYNINSRSLTGGSYNKYQIQATKAWWRFW